MSKNPPYKNHFEKDVRYIRHLSDRKNVWSQLRTKVSHLRNCARNVPLVTSIGKTALRVLQECRTSVSRISLIELRGGWSISACHFTCKLKHLTPARKQRDNYIYVEDLSRSCRDTLGIVSERFIEHILAFICQLKLRSDVFDVICLDIRDLDRNNEDGEREIS